ncbi:MAG TPA: hypothetical protein VFE61_21085 [Candidatus Sulfotelmatobacter sp.]|nr:hypothetical protein [Candidatus Sulfotelmatobacter sp.]
MQLLRSEAHTLSVWKLWAPFIFLALPTMLLTASLAVLFETLPVLRGGVGNVVYFFLWTAFLGLGATGLDDPSGLQLLYRSSRSALQAIDPSSPENFHFSLTIGGEHAVRTFPWNGLDWTVNVLLMRLLWIGIAAALALLASLFFHRFDPARSWRKHRVQPAASTLDYSTSDERSTSTPTTIQITAAHLTPLVRASQGRATGKPPFPQLVISELRLMLKGQRWWRYAAAVGILVGEVVSPEPSVRGGFLLAAWIWPILLWSQMGCREARNGTGPILFSCERSLSRQFPGSLDCWRTRRPAHRRWNRNSSCFECRLAQSCRMARRRRLHPQLRPGPRHLERQQQSFRSYLRGVVVPRPRTSNARSRLHGHDAVIKQPRHLRDGSGVPVGNLVLGTPHPPWLCLTCFPS